jgi:hypothetical protein
MHNTRPVGGDCAMTKILPAIGIAASLAATSANATPDPLLDKRNESLAEQTRGVQVPVPTEAFAQLINEMARELDARWRVAQNFNDRTFSKGRPFSKAPTFGKVGGGGGFVKFGGVLPQVQQPLRKNRPRVPRTNPPHGHMEKSQSDVATIFRQHKPT